MPVPPAPWMWLCHTAGPYAPPVLRVEAGGDGSYWLRRELHTNGFPCFGSNRTKTRARWALVPDTAWNRVFVERLALRCLRLDLRVGLGLQPRSGS